MKDQAVYHECVDLLAKLREIKAAIKELDDERAEVWCEFHRKRGTLVLKCEKCGNEVLYGDAGLDRWRGVKTDPTPLEPENHAYYSRFDCKPCGHVNKVYRDPKLDFNPW